MSTQITDDSYYEQYTIYPL